MLAVAERTDHPRKVSYRAVRSQQKPALESGPTPVFPSDHRHTLARPPHRLGGRCGRAPRRLDAEDPQIARLHLGQRDEQGGG